MTKTLHIFGAIILLFSIKYISNQTCGVANPESLSECEDDSSKNSICCYAQVSLLEKEETLCVYVPKSQVFITPFVTSMDIGLSPNNIEMNIDCGFKAGDIPQNESFSVCGENPENEEDCFKQSTETQSCCYIENPDSSKVCILNNGVYKSNSTYFGIKVICGVGYIGKFLYLNFLIFIFIIFA